MKQYQTTRIKLAGKILSVSTTNGTDSRERILNLEGMESFVVSGEFMDKHEPQVGWYFIEYPDDGYRSACPGDTFENGHVSVPVLEERPEPVPGPLGPADETKPEPQGNRVTPPPGAGTGGETKSGPPFGRFFPVVHIPRLQTGPTDAEMTAEVEAARQETDDE
jgi:hypothetical protein